MELNLERPRDYLFVRRADGHGVVIGDELYHASIILTRNRVIDTWHVSNIATMTPAHVDPLVELKPDVVLLGTGTRQTFPSQAVLAAFLRRGIGVEVMDNAAAARTWDILAGEGRNVVACFVLCDRP